MINFPPLSLVIRGDSLRISLHTITEGGRVCASTRHRVMYGFEQSRRVIGSLLTQMQNTRKLFRVCVSCAVSCLTERVSSTTNLNILTPYLLLNCIVCTVLFAL